MRLLVILSRFLTYRAAPLRVCVGHSPDDTPWEGGTFNLLLEFTEEYPNKAPLIKFVTKMFHPNSACPASLLHSPL